MTKAEADRVADEQAEFMNDVAKLVDIADNIQLAAILSAVVERYEYRHGKRLTLVMLHNVLNAVAAE